MPLTLQPPPGSTRRERLLVFGPPGSGKSWMWQRFLSATPDDVIFHVLDTDGAWETAADSEQFAPHAHRVVHTEPIDWPDYVNATKTAMKMMDRERGDWLIIDLADDAWEAAQDYYSDRKFAGDNDSEDFFESLVDGTADDDSQDNMAKWGTINKLYAPFAKAMIRVPGNLLVCATAKDLKKDKKGNYFRERKQDVRDFGGVGARPGGQKSLGHDVATVIYMTGNNQRNRQIELIKDRNREEAWGDETRRKNGDPAKEFLLGIAGWVPA